MAGISVYVWYQCRGVCFVLDVLSTIETVDEKILLNLDALREEIREHSQTYDMRKDVSQDKLHTYNIKQKPGIAWVSAPGINS